jgi:integrase
MTRHGPTAITVNQQVRHEAVGTPKGRTRRTIPMTDTRLEALRGPEEIRTAYVIRNLDGTAKTDNQSKNVSYRLCRWAGLPERGWRVLRHARCHPAAHRARRRG